MAVEKGALNKFDVVPTHLAVKAMRDNGYQNAAYALSELLDNAIQAGAKSIELLCSETEEQLPTRRRNRIKQVAVLDDGCGMSEATLRMALQFGNGTHLDDRSGIGRFGMGLPNSSISQCRRVDVWSWRDGVDSAVHSYLDIGEIERGDMTEVPQPKPLELPKFWRNVGTRFGKSGTLVVWSELDRCYWKTAKAIIDNSELLIGRMYRRFIDEGKCTIRLVQVLENDWTQIIERLAVANDPMYLMSHTSCPKPWNDQPMFRRYGEVFEVYTDVSFNGSNHRVTTRFSFAKEEARPSDNSGSTPHGQHARKNIGVSIMRAGRELELSRAWDIEYDPRERWWGVEVEFPPTLDEIFGVSNNKQSASYLSKAGEVSIEELLKSKTMHQLKEELQEEGDPLGPALEISSIIDRNLKQIRSLLKTQSKGNRRIDAKRHSEIDSPEQKGTAAIRKRQEDGFLGASDAAEESLTAEERVTEIKDSLVEGGLSSNKAEELAASTVSSSLKYVFHETDLESSAFFSVRLKGGAILITLNTAHPAYAHLLEVKRLPEDLNLETLSDIGELKAIIFDQQRQLVNTTKGLRLLLEAWARYEDEQPEGPRRTAVQDTRSEWGKVARQFLSE